MSEEKTSCAGYEGCHELEGSISELFVHDPACPKSPEQRRQVDAAKTSLSESAESERQTVEGVPERIWIPLPYAAVCSTVDRPDLPQQEYIRADLARANPAASIGEQDVAAERERCARIVAGGFPQEMFMYAEEVLDAIRNPQPLDDQK